MSDEENFIKSMRYLTRARYWIRNRKLTFLYKRSGSVEMLMHASNERDIDCIIIHLN